jgi:hypothetical protein
MEQRLTFDSSGKEPHVPDALQTWAVIYGRIEVQQALRPPKGNAPDRDWGNGFGHMNGAPVKILRKQENSVVIRDDDPVAAGAKPLN